MITITAPNGHIVKIAPREEAGKSLPPLTDGFEREPGRITRISSTEPQPFVSANFDGDTFIGGQTVTQSLLDVTLAKAAKAGLEVSGSL